nr:cytochrome P450 81D11-like [Ipomoea trifida]
MDMKATVLTEILIIFPSIFLKILRSARRRRLPLFRDTLSYNRPPPPPEAAASPYSIPPFPDSRPNRISQEIFFATCLNSFHSIRQDEVNHLLQSLYRDSKTSFAKVELKPKLGQTVFNVIMRMIDGMRYFGGNNNQETKNVPDLINEVLELQKLVAEETDDVLLRKQMMKA